MPIIQTHAMLGYTYSQVFNSYIWGYLFIFPVVYIGCLSGAFSAMMLSRYLFRDLVVGKIKKQPWLKANFEAINEILKEKGALSVCLLRLTFFPYGLCSYVLGVTDIAVMDFMLGTASYLINCMM
jgi:uncharacterized membrane protein YdjX (TVP38/TMEM64 family)